MTAIWITRTEPGAQKSATAWAAAGFDPVVAPLLSVHPVDSNAVIPDSAQLIFTSGQAVRHCGLKADHQTVYTVGEATADVARQAGFTDVTFADGDWRDLLSIIRPTDQPIVHVSGRTVRGRLVESLGEAGFKASRHIVYETQMITGWPLDPRTVQAVVLYSPMATDALMALPKRDLSHLTAYCLSEAVADGLEGLEIKVAVRPNETALIACSGVDHA
ncbi:MAG: uroporphyrinogen-III synthase [Pseudomonadota bacterium]